MISSVILYLCMSPPPLLYPGRFIIAWAIDYLYLYYEYNIQVFFPIVSTSTQLPSTRDDAPLRFHIT